MKTTIEEKKREIREMNADLMLCIGTARFLLEGVEQGMGDLLIDVLIEDARALKTSRETGEEQERTEPKAEGVPFLDAMSFGQAIAAVREGKRIARRGWNGKNQYVELATNISYKNWSGTIVNVDHSNIGSAALAFVGTSGVQLGWLASQADMLADDWYIADEPTRCFKADVAASERACNCAGVNKEARCHE